MVVYDPGVFAGKLPRTFAAVRSSHMSESQPGQLPAASSPTRPDDEPAPFALSQDPVTEQGPAPVPPVGAVPAPAYEHLGELPASYGTQSVYTVAYDPRQLFVYWDIDWKTAGAAPYTLHVCRGDGALEKRLDITPSDAGRYVETERPGGTYFVELGHHGRNGSWQPVAVSGRVTMPPSGLSGDLEPKFATLPFHLSFQRLYELINHAMGHGEDLTVALSRLQQGGEREVSPLLHTLHRLTGDQLHKLEMLLGQRFEIASDTSGPAGGVSGGGVSPGPGNAHEALSSGGFGSESLSSGGFGSEAPSSGGGFGSKSLVGGALGSDLLSSGAFGGESLSSFTPGPSSEAWRLAGRVGAGVGSDTMDRERAVAFLHAVEKNLDVLGSLFSGFSSPGGSDGFSAGGW